MQTRFTITDNNSIGDILSSRHLKTMGLTPFSQIWDNCQNIKYMKLNHRKVFQVLTMRPSDISDKILICLVI